MKKREGSFHVLSDFVCSLAGQRLGRRCLGLHKVNGDEELKQMPAAHTATEV